MAEEYFSVNIHNFVDSCCLECKIVPRVHQPVDRERVLNLRELVRSAERVLDAWAEHVYWVRANQKNSVMETVSFMLNCGLIQIYNHQSRSNKSNIVNSMKIRHPKIHSLGNHWWVNKCKWTQAMAGRKDLWEKMKKLGGMLYDTAQKSILRKCYPSKYS